MDEFERMYREYFQYVFFYVLRLCQDREMAEEYPMVMFRTQTICLEKLW